MAEKYRNKYRISSARLQHWDYGRNAAYFVTICTQNREHYFGEIRHGIMHPSEIGVLAQQFWLEIPNHFPFVELDEFVVMPNHVHGIIIINNPVQTLHAVDTLHADPVQTLHADSVQTLHATSLRKNKQMASISPKQGSLSTIIRSYKSAVTKNARNIHADFAWQSRFHDHVIRNDQSYHRIKAYIRNNPLVWKKDKFCK